MAVRALGPSSLAVVQAVATLPAASWVVGCSGGADSLALAWAACHVARTRGTPVRAVVIDHGLQAGSDETADAVAGTLAAFGMPAEVRRVSVRVHGGVEAAAREARYAAFEASLDTGERLLLGHTLDDQAETVLLGLARGAGVRALAGMPAERGPYLRPLLGVRRGTTAEACAELGLTPWHDPHNSDQTFARVRVRLHALPALEGAVGPGIAEALARTASMARADADLLDALAGGGEGDPHADYLRGLDPALRTRAIRDWLTASGVRDLGSVHVRSVERLVTDWRGQAGVDVPGGRVVRMDGHLRWRPHSR